MFKNKASIVMSVAAASVVMTTGIGYAAERGVVTADSLNIRSGPSTSYSIKAKVTKGTVVNLGKKSNGWYEVSLANGVSGWASGSYIEVIKTENSQQGEIIDATYLREEAKWTTNKLALLNTGTKVEVISTDVNWTKAKYDGKVGYIANQCMKIISLPEDNTESDKNTTQMVGKISGDTYLREEAKWTTNKLALLKAGTKVEVISTDVNWTKVKCNGQIGYITNDYIEITKNESAPTVPDVNTKNGEIVSGATYLRKESNWSSEKLVLLQEGTKVEIISTDVNWTKVKYGNQIGYVSNDYVREITGSTVNEDELKKDEGRILELIYLRDSDNWSANKLMVLQPGTKVKILEKGINWTKVNYQGNVGYVGNAYIEVGGEESNDSNREEKVAAVISLAKAQIGKPYEWGSEGPNSFDCSGLMYYVFKNGAGITLPRSSKDQAKVGKAVLFNDMQPGDIISFDFDGDGVVTHVGMYIGNEEFIHARKPGTFVETTSISSTYWKNAIYGIRRVIE